MPRDSKPTRCPATTGVQMTPACTPEGTRIAVWQAVLMDTLVTAEDLQAMLDSGQPLTVLDVRWSLEGPDGHQQFGGGHVPGAVYVDLERELSEPRLPADQGRHPLPRLDTLQSAARRWGLDAGDTVVVYDDLSNMASARAWWLLRRAGISDVRVLDGALRAWRAAGLPLETGDVTPTSGTALLQDPSQEPRSGEAVASMGLDEVAALSRALDLHQEADAVLLDVRAAERYTGAHEPVDPRAGHIPGAVNLPTAGLVDERGRLLPPEQLRAHLLAAGAREDQPVVSYCGSGINAAHATLAAHLAGFDAVLYPGSFSQWSQDPGRRVVSG